MQGWLFLDQEFWGEEQARALLIAVGQNWSETVSLTHGQFARCTRKKVIFVHFFLQRLNARRQMAGDKVGRNFLRKALFS